MSDGPQVTHFVRYMQAGGLQQTLSMVGAASAVDAVRRLTRLGTADLVGSVEVWTVERPPAVFAVTFVEQVQDGDAG